MLTITIPESEAPRSQFRTFNCTEKQAIVISRLRLAHKGFGAVKGYRPTTNWEVSPVQNIQFIAGFRTSLLYTRRIERLQRMKFGEVDVSKWIASKGRDAFNRPDDQFYHCRSSMCIKMHRSLDGNLGNAHTRAHSRNYCGLTNSIKVNFVTEKDANGHEIPVLDEHGIPTVASILIPYLEIKTKTIKEGKRKVKNSGSKVLMDNAIMRAMGKRFAIKMLSLKDNNFQEVVIGREHISREDLYDADNMLNDLDEE